MTVVAFPLRPREDLRDWQSAELQQLVDACAVHLAKGDASGWETGRTELEDPQFYLLGPVPEQDCILCVSRVGRLYVLEDGKSNVVAEDACLRTVTAKAERMTFSRRKAAFVVRVTCAWYGLREFFEEKLEPMLAEPAELLAHFGPHVAILA